MQNEIYQNLLEDCKSIIKESWYRQNINTLEARYELGRAIYQANDEMKRQKIYGKGIVEKLSAELGEGYSPANLYDCIAFYKKYPPEKYETFSIVVENLPGGKETSWRDMRDKYLRTKPQEAVDEKKGTGSRKFDQRSVETAFQAFAEQEMGWDRKKIELFWERFKNYLNSNQK